MGYWLVKFSVLEVICSSFICG